MNTAVPLLSYSCMFQVKICSQQLEICKSMCMFCSDDCRSWPCEEKFWSDDCRSWPCEEKINNHGFWGKQAHIPDNDYWGICLFHVVWNNFFWAIILMWYTLNTRIYIFFFINWTLRMSDNLPERVQILCHTHIICITVLENRIICCQIFCDLLLKSAFEWIFSVKLQLSENI